MSKSFFQVAVAVAVAVAAVVLALCGLRPSLWRGGENEVSPETRLVSTPYSRNAPILQSLPHRLSP